MMGIKKRIAMIVTALSMFAAPMAYQAATAAPAHACTNCGNGTWLDDTGVDATFYTNISWPNPLTFGQYLLEAQTYGGTPTWSGCGFLDEKYSMRDHVLWVATVTYFTAHEGIKWCWGPGDHVNYEQHLEYSSSVLWPYSFNGIAGQNTGFDPYPGRNWDSSWHDQTVFHYSACVFGFCADFYPIIDTHVHGNGSWIVQKYNL